MVWPAALYVAGLALLARVSALVWVAVTVAVAGAEVAPLPEAVAVLVFFSSSGSPRVLLSFPARRSADPAATGALPPRVIVPSLSSLTEKGPARVTLPELVIVYV